MIMSYGSHLLYIVIVIALLAFQIAVVINTYLSAINHRKKDSNFGIIPSLTLDFYLYNNNNNNIAIYRFSSIEKNILLSRLKNHWVLTLSYG